MPECGEGNTNSMHFIVSVASQAVQSVFMQVTAQFYLVTTLLEQALQQYNKLLQMLESTAWLQLQPVSGWVHEATDQRCTLSQVISAKQMKVTMKSQNAHSTIAINEQVHVTRDQLNSLLDTYNRFFIDKENLQLQYVQTEDSFPLIEGVLSIFWGVRHPIRLKIQDDQHTPVFLTSKLPVFCEHDNLFPGPGCASYDMKTLQLKDEQDFSVPFLPRTMSLAATLGMQKDKLPTIARKEETHRFSINGHFYNYQTSIFTPAFGSATKIRISSNMRTSEVIQQLLKKFKIENSASEFALHIIHASGEKKRLKSTDIPLLGRILLGPLEKVAQVFLMDKDAEEVSSDVAQYIKFPLSLLESILHKLNEKEEQEIQETTAKYQKEKAIINEHLLSRSVFKTETTV
ncbi:ras association domain-containing protein 6 [Tiliqua scincoides]|uniref:ras association domain-containing protein 6 n=1 Tax=Tiliqua scincoides TaxID=71010 RepID=UPI0034627792